jgi:hypothetical protein
MAVTDQPGGRFLIRGRHREKGAHIVMIGAAFVDEALAIARDGDEAGFAAFDKMGKRVLSPLPFGTSETGAHATGSTWLVSTTAPSVSAMRRPSPVLLSGAAL